MRVGIDLAHQHLDRLAELQDVAGVFDPLPGELADVQQAVDAAQIDECAERLQAAATTPSRICPSASSVSNSFLRAAFSPLDHGPRG